MQSVLREITKLRSGTPIVIDYHNSNRYRLVVQENNGTKTAYCFSAPIYNRKTRKLIDMKFRRNGDAIYTTGSNANITLLHNLLMETVEGSIAIDLPQKPILLSSQEVQCGICMLSPTTNGVAVRWDVSNTPQNSFTMET